MSEQGKLRTSKQRIRLASGLTALANRFELCLFLWRQEFGIMNEQPGAKVTVTLKTIFHSAVRDGKIVQSPIESMVEMGQ